MAIAEICCGSFQDALVAQQAGASRIELNGGLELGGLTPSIATLQLVKQETSLQVIAMVRPRGAGFLYSIYEKKVMLLEADQLLRHHVDGIAFGCLNNDLTIDQEMTTTMVALIHSFGKQAVFHRAFDQVTDPYKAMETLIACQVDRVLTSGLHSTAIDGTAMLRNLQQRFGSRIEILAGSGINHNNCMELIKATDINQVHGSCKAYVEDSSTISNVSYAIFATPHESCYVSVDLRLASQFISKVHERKDTK